MNKPEHDNTRTPFLLCISKPKKWAILFEIFRGMQQQKLYAPQRDYNFGFC